MLRWGRGGRGRRQVQRPWGKVCSRYVEGAAKRTVWREAAERERENRRMRGDRGNVVPDHVKSYRLLQGF